MLHQTLYGSFVVKYDAPYYSSWLRFRAGLCLWKNIPKWNIEMCRSKHMGVNWTVLMKCETLSLIYYQCTEKFSGLLLPPPPLFPSHPNNEIFYFKYGICTITGVWQVFAELFATSVTTWCMGRQVFIFTSKDKPLVFLGE